MQRNQRTRLTTVSANVTSHHRSLKTCWNWTCYSVVSDTDKGKSQLKQTWSHNLEQNSALHLLNSSNWSQNRSICWMFYQVSARRADCYCYKQQNFKPMDQTFFFFFLIKCFLWAFANFSQWMLYEALSVQKPKPFEVYNLKQNLRNL